MWKVFLRNSLRCLEVCYLLSCQRRCVLGWDVYISVSLTPPPGSSHTQGVGPHSLSRTTQEVGLECSPQDSRWEAREKLEGGASLPMDNEMVAVTSAARRRVASLQGPIEGGSSCRTWQTATTGAIRRTDQERIKRFTAIHLNPYSFSYWKIYWWSPCLPLDITRGTGASPRICSIKLWLQRKFSLDLREEQTWLQASLYQLREIRLIMSRLAAMWPFPKPFVLGG